MPLDLWSKNSGARFAIGVLELSLVRFKLALVIYARSILPRPFKTRAWSPSSIAAFNHRECPQWGDDGRGKLGGRLTQGDPSARIGGSDLFCDRMVVEVALAALNKRPNPRTGRKAKLGGQGPTAGGKESVSALIGSVSR